MSVIKDKDNNVILTLNGTDIHLGHDTGQRTNILSISGTTVVRGWSINYKNRGVETPDGLIVYFQNITAGTAPTDRLAVYRGDTNDRIGTMVRVAGGGKVAGALYRGSGVEDENYIGIDPSATDGAGAATIAYLLILQPRYAETKGYANRYSNTVTDNNAF